MQKATGTILIAFLAGIVVAEGTAYFLSSHHEKAAQPAEQVASAPAPAVRPPAAASIAAQPEQQEAAAAAPAKSQPAPAETANAPKHKHSPAVQRDARAAANNETAAAPQPKEAELAQNSGSGAPQENSNQQDTAQQANVPQQNAALNPAPGTQTAPPPPTPQTVTIAAGTLLPVRLNEAISTDTDYPGDAFTATLEKPLVVNGFIIADRGARVTGKVVQAERAGRVKGVADLQLALTKLHTTDGQTVDIVTAPWDKRGQTSKKRDTAEMAGGAALGAIIGAIAGGGKGAAIGAGTGGAAGTGVVLSRRGKSATIPSETRLTFTLDNPVTITERL